MFLFGYLKNVVYLTAMTQNSRENANDIEIKTTKPVKHIKVRTVWRKKERKKESEIKWQAIRKNE